MDFTLGKRHIRVFESPDKKAPLVVINLFMGEGEKLWDELSKKPHGKFTLCCISGLDWGHDMAPWDQEALVKDSSSCTAGAQAYLHELDTLIIPKIEQSLKLNPQYRVLCGYSLGGLFALWALHHSTLYRRIGSFSGSLWMPDFIPYLSTHPLKVVPERLYLSLGDREKLCSHPLIATVEQRTLQALDFYRARGAHCAFEFNPGAHELNCNWRCARGILALVSKNPPIFSHDEL